MKCFLCELGHDTEMSCAAAASEALKIEGWRAQNEGLRRELTQANKAANALVRWRRAWERESASPPSLNMGQMPSEIHMWAVAGRIMRARGIKPRLAG